MKFNLRETILIKQECIEFLLGTGKKTKIDIYTRFKTSTYYLMSIALSTFLTLLYIFISHQWNAQAFSLVLLILFIFLVGLSWIIFRFQSKQFCYTDSLNSLESVCKDSLESLFLFHSNSSHTFLDKLYLLSKFSLYPNYSP